MAKVKRLQHTGNGRIFVPTDALMKRADMRVIYINENQSIGEPIDDGYLAGGDDDELDETTGKTGNVETNVGEGDNDADTDTDESDSDESQFDFSNYSDDDLLAMAKAEPYKLKVSKNMNRSTVEAKLREAMGG